MLEKGGEDGGGCAALAAWPRTRDLPLAGKPEGLFVPRLLFPPFPSLGLR